MLSRGEGVVQGKGGVVTFDPGQGGGRCCLGEGGVVHSSPHPRVEQNE